MRRLPRRLWKLRQFLQLLREEPVHLPLPSSLLSPTPPSSPHQACPASSRSSLPSWTSLQGRHRNPSVWRIVVQPLHLLDPASLHLSPPWKRGHGCCLRWLLALLLLVLLLILNLGSPRLQNNNLELQLLPWLRAWFLALHPLQGLASSSPRRALSRPLLSLPVIPTS